MTWDDMREDMAGLKAALSLDHTPIGIAFVEKAPPGASRPDRAVPSGCSFWRMAEMELIYTRPEDHFNCPIGVMTMGFQIPSDREGEAKSLLNQMCEIEYISPEELGQIPVKDQGHGGVLYGPLAQLPSEPDAALFICRPSQAMLLAEAAGQLAWKERGGFSAFGRPTCAVIPTSMKFGAPSMSVGCIGARVNASLGDDELIMAIPGSQLYQLISRLRTILEANATLEDLHVARRAQF